MATTYGYARVSAIDQNLATQLDALTRDGCDKIFQEKITGVATARPELDKLLAVLEPGDTVKVSRFFRLGRNALHLLELIEMFNKLDVRFIALDLGVDTRTPAGRLVVTVFAGMAQFMREETKEKSAHGIALAKASGKHMGRRPGLDQKKVLKIKTALDAGMSLAQVVEVTGIPETTVKRYRRAIRNE